MSHVPLLHSAATASVFHPSDFSEASEIAFAHALKIALMSRATLHMLHVSGESDLPWTISRVFGTPFNDGGSFPPTVHEAP